MTARVRWEQSLLNTIERDCPWTMFEPIIRPRGKGVLQIWLGRVAFVLSASVDNLCKIAFLLIYALTRLSKHATHK
jgi:hypothetical protein